MDASNVLLVIKGAYGAREHAACKGKKAGTQSRPRKDIQLPPLHSPRAYAPGLRDRVMEDAKNEKTQYSTLVSKTLALVKAVVCDTASNGVELYMEGKANIFDQPEFKEDVQRIVRLFRAFEEKSLLLRILDRSIRVPPRGG